MKKRFILSGLVLMLLFGLSTTDQQLVYASSYDCEITIDANKHSWGNFATQTSGCEMAVVHGYFAGDQGFQLTGSYSGEVTNGQIIEAETDRIKVNTIALKKPEPKPAPKPEPKPKQEPKPEKTKEVKPKQEPKPQPKPEPKPQPKPELKKEQKPKTEKPKSSSNSSSKPSKSDSGSKTSTASSSTTAKNTKEVSGDKKELESEKRLTIKELKDKNAEVIRENGKIYAKVDNVKQEITEEEAKKLESDERVEEEKEELNLKEKEDEEKEEVTPVVKNEQDKGNSGFGLLITIAIIVVFIITLVSLYYFHPKSREKMDEILAKGVEFFKFGKKKQY